MNSKSKKIQSVIVNGYGSALVSQRPNGRICKAWQSDEVLNGEPAKFILTAQNEGMPVDYTEEHTSVESLEKSMREFADLRHWVFDSEALL